MSDSLKALPEPGSFEGGLLPLKPYHSKRPHKKSRAGCRNCKTRKVKCDEARPVCRSCRQRKTECIYLDLPTAPAQAPVPSARSTARSSTASSSSSSSSSSSLDIQPVSTASGRPLTHGGASALKLSRRSTHRETGIAPGILIEPFFRPSRIDDIDMKLLWFYTTKTFTSFSAEDSAFPVNSVMKNGLVQYAFNSPFLMDSIFALSSIHLQNMGLHFNSGRALYYRAKSFEGYRKAVQTARPEDYPALMANSLLMVAISSQVFRDPDGKHLYMLDWMIVWKGIGLIIELIGLRTLIKTGLHSLFFRPKMDLEKAENHIPSQLLHMITSITPDDPEFSDRKSYHDALKCLGSLFMHLREGFCPVMTLRISTIFTFVPTGYITLSRIKSPRALVILAYLSIFYKIANDDLWWLAGVGQRSLIDICDYLGPEWHYLIASPLKAIHVNGPTELARLVLEDPSWEPRPGVDLVEDLDWVDDLGRSMDVCLNGEILLTDVSVPDRAPVWMN